MGPLGHYLLRGREAWNDFALQASLLVLGDQRDLGRMTRGSATVCPSR